MFKMDSTAGFSICCKPTTLVELTPGIADIEMLLLQIKCVNFVWHFFLKKSSELDNEPTKFKLREGFCLQ
jgi:hypothetical protein